MRPTLPLLICASFIVPGALPALGGAWPQREGGYYLKVTGNYLNTGKERDFLGKRLDIFQERLSFTDATFTDAGVSAYGEYGLTRRATIVASLPFRRLVAERDVNGGAYFDAQKERETTTGFGDFSGGVRYGVLFSPVALSFQGDVKIPLGYAATPANGGPPLGTGDVDASLRVLAGKSFAGGRFYLSGGGGYRIRGGVYNDEYLFEGEAGMTGAGWVASVAVTGVENSENPGDLVGAPVTTPLPGGGGSFEVPVGDQNYVVLTPSLSLSMGGNRWFTFELSDLVAGKNTVDGTTLSAGLVMRN